MSAESLRKFYLFSEKRKKYKGIYWNNLVSSHCSQSSPWILINCHMGICFINPHVYIYTDISTYIPHTYICMIYVTITEYSTVTTYTHTL